MQGGIHLLSGLILASLFKRKESKLGAAFGAIVPDIDLFVAAIGYLFIGDAAVVLHRTFTHSIFTIILLFSIFGLLHYFLNIKKGHGYDYLGLGIGLVIGMVVHVFLDLFYLVGVQVFWPIFQKEIAFNLVPEAALTTLQLKLLQTTDFYTDIFLFYIPVLILAFKWNKHPRIRLPFLIYAIIDYLTITFFVVFSFNANISYIDHLVYLYYPGTFFLVFSVFSPLIFRDVIREFQMPKHEIVVILSLFVFSQFLFALFLI